MPRSEKEIYDVAQRMVLRVLEMEPGDRTTVARLVKEVEPSLLEEDSGDTMFDEPIEHVTEALFDLAGDEGDLLLDMSEHDGKFEGRTYNLDFIVRRRISGKEHDIDELLQKLEWAHFELRHLGGGAEMTFRRTDEGSWVYVDGFVGSLQPDFWRAANKQNVQKLKKLLKGTGALLWEGEYWEPALDGTNWTLHLRFSDGTYFESTGSNGYPAGFNALVDGLIDLGLKTEAYDYEGD